MELELITKITLTLLVVHSLLYWTYKFTNTNTNKEEK